MVTSKSLLALLATERVLPIIRTDTHEKAIKIGLTLAEFGFKALEVSLTTPKALDAIRELSGMDSVEVGAGTVLTSANALAARDAGATFIVTPAITESLETAVHMNIPVLAGAFTPTEILTAYEAGATAVKLFPAGAAGPSYFSAIRAPLPDIPLIPVGGITVSTGIEYLSRGALALGVGSPLTGGATDPMNMEALKARAQEFRSLRTNS